MITDGIALLGWAATAVFVSSYFFRRPSMLRGLQMFGSVLWMTYGLLIKAPPVIVANVLVFSAAAWTMLGRRNPPCSTPQDDQLAAARIARASDP